MHSALKRCGAYPTHEGAGKTFTDPGLSKELDQYAREVEELYTPDWERECAWVEKWMEVMDHPSEKIKARRRAYYARQEKVQTPVAE